eukprot:GHVN01075326.1.p1 GENE.GHVN01075326.1~~GHVN01075326.1.p1  ORF type:complete len:217 (+),score=21.70 GHVN01075326.1:138-788(+)
MQSRWAAEQPPQHQTAQLSLQPSQPPPTEFKTVIIGEAGVGKSSFVESLLPERRLFFPYCGAQVSRVVYKTNKAPIIFNIWDTAGQEVFGEVHDSFYRDAQCAVLMFDTTSLDSYKALPLWYRDMCRVCDMIPTVLVGNKVDVHDRRVKPKQIVFHRKKNLQYYDISATSRYNLDKPLLWIAKSLTKSSDLQLVDSPRLKVGCHTEGSEDIDEVMG